jgi:hypothetical protein
MSMESLDPRNDADVAAVAGLHTQYLETSLVVRLGDRFLRRFYYRVLVKDDLIHCTICRVDNRIVGFHVCTKYPNDVIARGVRKHFVRLAWLMLVSVVQRPRLLREIWQAFLAMRSSREDEPHDPGTVGEGMSLVTEKEYRDYVVPETGRRVPEQLFECMKQYFSDAGYSRIVMYIEPSNIASNRFHIAMGCRLIKPIWMMGKPSQKFYYDLKPQKPAC